MVTPSKKLARKSGLTKPQRASVYGNIFLSVPKLSIGISIGVGYRNTPARHDWAGYFFFVKYRTIKPLVRDGLGAAEKVRTCQICP